jgi:hypothetical protein
MPKRTKPPAHQQSPRADRGGPESSTRAFTCLSPSMRACGWPPSRSAGKSTVSCWKGSNWRYGSVGGRVDGWA